MEKNIKTEMIFRDQLTGAYNKEYFFESGNQMLQLAIRNKVPLSVCIMGIDDLDNINDSYNVAIGNQIIESIAQGTIKICRSSDLVSYLGEGKIGLVLYNISGIDTNNTLHTLRSKIDYILQGVNAADLKVTVSIGACIVHTQTNAKTLEVAYNQALFALDAGKEKESIRVY